MLTKHHWIGFALSSLGVLLVVAVVGFHDQNRSRKAYQQAFNRLAEEKTDANVPIRKVNLRIKQIWNPALSVVDRCVSCHLGMGVPAMANAPRPFRTHPLTPHKFERLGCTICHRGQGPATTAAAAHGRGRWWEDPMLPSLYTQASCGQCHRGAEVPEAYVLIEGRRLMTQAACIACHEIPGFQKPEQIGPDLTGIGSKVNAAWLYRWLRHPKDYLTQTWMPDPKLPKEEVKILTTFLLAHRDSSLEASSLPIEPPDFDEQTIETGRRLYSEARCISCHAQNGRGGTIGPEMTRVASKVTYRWLVSWLKNPRAYLPRTRMPQFSFPAKDVSAVAAYIESEFVDEEQDPEEAPAIEGSLPRPSEDILRQGEVLFLKYGCAGCHTMADVIPKGKLGPELEGIGAKDVDRLDFGKTTVPRTLWSWLFLKVQDPRAFGGNLRMPDYELSDEQTHAVTTALLSITGRDVPSQFIPPVETRPSYNPQGPFAKILEKYKCLTCHRILGRGGDLAPDLSIVASQAKSKWIADYFRLPYSLRPILEERMPLLHMSDEEIETSVNYMELVLANDQVPRQVNFDLRDPALIKRGRELFYEQYACHGCHQVNLQGGYVGPALDGVNHRLYPGYIFQYLKDPSGLRPETIEPNRGLNDDEAAALTAYVYSLPPVRMPGASTGGR